MLDMDQLAPETLRPISRAEYDRLVELGMFEDERVELLRGMLVQMSPQGTPHAEAIQRLTMVLVVAVQGRALARVQLPFAASEDSEPEPDFAIVPLGSYRDAHPTEALLVVEVAASSLEKDRHIKGALYAAAGVPEYWIVNLVDDCIDVHTEPERGAYGAVTRRTRGEQITLVALPEVTVAVADLLP